MRLVSESGRRALKVLPVSLEYLAAEASRVRLASPELPGAKDPAEMTVSLKTVRTAVMHKRGICYKSEYKASE